ncbi:MAG: cupin domain-containing protein [Oscillochloris sp.]|nr:cupin domain-containing protein [Oscillochloris sp.]
MNKDFDFENLFVLDLANNHQGQASHGLQIIREIGAVVAANGARAALKFQFRQLDTFIHPQHREGSDNKHIPRFLSTRLSNEEYARLAAAVREAGMVTMATPFDEESVDMILDLDLDVVKVASCSATDWPLLEAVAACNKPVIFSTGGLTLKEIDDLVSFFEHRRVHFAVMHCVSIYPTPDHQLELNQIELLRRRYPQAVIGFSTHEVPSDLAPVYVAVAKGARMLERHVGLPAPDIRLNAYSSTPEQIDAWIKAAQKALVICGHPQRPPAPPEEIEALDSLKRGVYACRPLKAGVELRREDVFFAMPCAEGQISAGQWKEGIVAREPLAKDQALLLGAIEVPQNSEKQILFTSIHTIKAMLNEARIALPTDFETEFSHHYGLGNFAQYGATLITCINRSYCKKLVIQTPGQQHPLHYHKRKEETFQVLYGVLELEIEGRRRTLYPGDTILVQQGVWHQFWTETGVIFEEISTTHYNNDSFYEDKAINRLDRSERKTNVNQWGRYQV